MSIIKYPYMSFKSIYFYYYCRRELVRMYTTPTLYYIDRFRIDLSLSVRPSPIFVFNLFGSRMEAIENESDKTIFSTISYTCLILKGRSMNNCINA